MGEAAWAGSPGFGGDSSGLQQTHTRPPAQLLRHQPWHLFQARHPPWTWAAQFVQEIGLGGSGLCHAQVPAGGCPGVTVLGSQLGEVHRQGRRIGGGKSRDPGDGVEAPVLHQLRIKPTLAGMTDLRRGMTKRSTPRWAGNLQSTGSMWTGPDPKQAEDTPPRRRCRTGSC